MVLWSAKSRSFTSFRMTSSFGIAEGIAEGRLAASILVLSLD